MTIAVQQVTASELSQTYRVWNATTRDQPSLSKCRRSSAGVSVNRFSIHQCEHEGKEILTAKTNVVVVHQSINGVELPTNVVIFGAVEEETNGRVLWVTSKDKLGLLFPAKLS